MIKNEIDIIDAFLEHICSCFDVAYLCDNMSNDGTYEKIVDKANQTGKIKVFRLDSRSQIQSVLVSYLVNSCFVDTNPDFLFLLDADEFLPFSDAAMLNTCLTSLDTELFFMNWDNMALDPSGRLINAPIYRSTIQKVVICRSAKSKVGNIIVDAGNHNIKRSRRLKTKEPPFRLIHVPIRSKEQLIKKLFTGNIAMILSRENINYHWKLLAESCFANMESIDEIALKYGVRYGENIGIDNIMSTDVSCMQWAGPELAWLESLLASCIISSEADIYMHIFNSISQCRDAACHNRDGVLYDAHGNMLKIFRLDLLSRLQHLFRVN